MREKMGLQKVSHEEIAAQCLYQLGSTHNKKYIYNTFWTYAAGRRCNTAFFAEQHARFNAFISLALKGGCPWLQCAPRALLLLRSLGTTVLIVQDNGTLAEGGGRREGAAGILGRFR